MIKRDFVGAYGIVRLHSEFSYDDGKPGCALGRGSLFGAAPLVVVFVTAWRGRRRRRV